MLWSALISKTEQTDEARRKQISALLKPLVAPPGVFIMADTDKAKLDVFVERVIGVLDLKPVITPPTPPREPGGPRPF